MNASARTRRIVLILLGAALLLWVLALLYLARVTPVFLWIGKRIGTITQLVIMLLGPIAAAVLARPLPDAPLLRRVASYSAIVSTIAFAFLIAQPMLEHWRTPKTPLNPTTPRPVPEMTGLAVFPGAEGFGTRTIAGRGGKVLFVTTLADDGPGSLRNAVNQPFPRTILFRVSGTIELRSHLFVSQPFVTIAGQSAPGDGICLKDAGLAIITHDVLVQHLRVRPGNEGDVDGDTNDALQLMGKHGSITDGASNVVIDHCSFSWGEDETVSTWYGANNITISHCFITEALNRSRHRKGTHSAGLIIGDSSWHVTVHHTLMAHNGFRNPLISGGGTHDLVNNVAYDWDNLPAQVSDSHGNSFINFINNYFIHGPTSANSVPSEIVVDRSYGIASPKLYLSGNLGPHRPTADLDEWDLVRMDWGDERPDAARYKADKPFPTWSVTIQPTMEALTNVLETAGATLPKRDAVDTRIVTEVRTMTGRMIDSPADVGGYPRLQTSPPPKDSDNDGIPDAWELEHRLNPNDATDGNRDRNDDGYTNLDEYLHSYSRK